MVATTFQPAFKYRSVTSTVMRDTTVGGVAVAAGIACGVWRDDAQLVSFSQIDRVFEPENTQSATSNFQQWLSAVERAKHWVGEPGLK